MTTAAFDGILFDLDGTLTDSAPQLAASANVLRSDAGLPPLCYAALRDFAGKGARGLIWAALRIAPGSSRFESLKAQFLSDYEARLTEPALLFPGIEALLSRLSEAGVPWGIVTNKSEHLARLVVESSPVLSKAQCLVGGDTVGKMKPEPDSVLEGMNRLDIDPRRSIYAGDDERDMIAGRAAGATTCALRWGYVAGGSRTISKWPADHVITSADELERLILAV